MKTSARLSVSGDGEKKKVKRKYDARDLEKGCGRLWREKRERRPLSPQPPRVFRDLSIAHQATLLSWNLEKAK